MGGDYGDNDMNECCKMKHVDSEDEDMSGLYVLLGAEPYWKLPSYCYSPCVYVKMEDIREVQAAMNGMGSGDMNMDGYEDPVPMDGNNVTTKRPEMPTGSSSNPDYMGTTGMGGGSEMGGGSGMGGGSEFDNGNNLSKLQKFIKKVNRLQKYCFRPSEDTQAMCAASFFPQGFGLADLMDNDMMGGMATDNMDTDMGDMWTGSMDDMMSGSMDDMGSGEMSGKKYAKFTYEGNKEINKNFPRIRLWGNE